MGLIEDIGIKIGEAFGGLADFFGDVFGMLLRGFGADMLDVGTDMLTNTATDVQNESSFIKADATILQEEMVKPIEEGFEHTVQEINKKHSEVTPYEAALEVAELKQKAKIDGGVAVITGIAIEAASIGQIETPMAAFNHADKVSGMTALAANAAALEFQVKQLEPYERYLRHQNPNVIAESSDLVRFALREVWDPTRREELLAEGAPGQFYDWMLDHGYPQERAADFWAAHWVLPAVGQLNEMLHRRVIDSSTWDRFVKYNDFDPEVRPWLKAISYNPYTRVDIRRMWDLGLVSRQEVKENYLDLGYDEEHAEKMTVWTLAYVLSVELRAKYSKGWITEADIRAELAETGMPADRIDNFVQKIIKAEEEARTGAERDLTKTDVTRSVKKGLITKDEGAIRLQDLGYSEDEAYFIIDAIMAEQISEEIEKDRELSKSDILEGVSVGVIPWADGKTMLINLGYSEEEADYILEIRVPPAQTRRIIKERDLTKAEIVKGVKNEFLTFEDGTAMLVDLGYDTAEAEYILIINVEALTGSPHTWSEFQEIVNKGRAAVRQPVKELPEGIQKLEKDIQKQTKIRETAVKAKKTREELIEIDNVLNPLKRQHKQIVREYRKVKK